MGQDGQFFLGIDLGTTVCTALVMDAQGTVLARESRPITARYPSPGRVEQDPEELVDAVVQVCTPLCQRFEIAAAGLDNQGESFVLFDAQSGAPLTPNIVWQDQRGAEVCDALRPRVDASWLRERTGLLLDSYFSAPKVAHELRTRPELRAAADAGTLRFGTTETYVLHRLTGGGLHVTDPSTASRTLLFNIQHGAWDEELCALFGVPMTMLPRVVPSGGRIGELRLPGVERGIPLFALLTDQQAALFGQACFSSGEAKCTLGTGAFVLMNVGKEPRRSSHGLLTTVAWQLGSETHFAFDGGIFAAGAAVQWLQESLKVIPSVAESDAVASRASDDDVVVVPSLCGLGAPQWVTEARGAVFGLSRGSTDADVVRATLRGIACQVHDVLRAMEKDAGTALASLRVDGGPTRNGFLMQCLADVLQVPVHVAADEEATAKGSAMIAATALGAVGMEQWRERWRARTAHQPRMDPSARGRMLERWERAVAALKVFHAR